MKTIDQRLAEAVKIIEAGDKNYVAEAAGKMLNYEPKNGDKVVVVGDTITGIDGLCGTVVETCGSGKGLNAGYIKIRTAGGVEHIVQDNLCVQCD